MVYWMLKVKDIKERCGWKSYKVLHAASFKTWVKVIIVFEYGKTVRFGKELIFLANFKDEKQRQKAINKSI
ncbi:hypothetical protein RhiirC2_759464 [Rhizophagus irregularis]|uniref:Uncharacterized protein n=1 Tax=Rhizophagus irregularis TaxID=588596 RepID=A0A2N1MLL0_9GLOM|nr:hypothetical protein RhiirC2_759464 [Rhizophagus irregularis]